MGNSQTTFEETLESSLPALSAVERAGRLAFRGGPARGGDGRVVRGDRSPLQDLQHPRGGRTGLVPRSTPEPRKRDSGGTGRQRPLRLRGARRSATGLGSDSPSAWREPSGASRALRRVVRKVFEGGPFAAFASHTGRHSRCIRERRN